MSHSRGRYAAASAKSSVIEELLAALHAPAPRGARASSAAFTPHPFRKASGVLATVGITGAMVFATAVPSNAQEVVTGTAAAKDVQSLTLPAGEWNQQAELDRGGLTVEVHEPEPEPAQTEQATTSQSAQSDASASSSTSQGSSSQTSDTPQTAVAGGKGADLVSTALLYRGVPYVYGGGSPTTGFDCSGFTAYVYGLFGISLPHNSEAQRASGTVVSSSAAQPGDLVWWPGHIGIYLGNGQMVHAPQPGESVKISSLWGSPTFIHVG